MAQDSLDRVRLWSGPSRHLGLALPLVSGLLLPAQAWVLAHIIDQALVGGARPGTLGPLLGVLLALLIGRAALNGLADHFANGAAETAKLRIRTEMVAAIDDKGPIWSRGQSSGELAALVVEHVEALDGYLGRYMPALIQASVLPLAFSVLILPLDWVVGLLFLVTVPLIPLFMALAGWGAEAASRQQAQVLSRLNGYFADRLRGLTTLKLLGREDAEVAGVASASAQLRQRTLRVLRIAFLSSAVLEFFAALGVAGVALYTGLSLLGLVNLRFTPMGLELGLFCLLMAPEVYQPIRTLATHHHDRAAARAAFDEIVGKLPAPGTAPVAAPPAARPKAVVGDGDLRVEQLAVDTPDGTPILRGLDLAVAAGEHVTIFGPSGAGKSTLVEVLAGLRPYRGDVHLGGESLSGIAPAILRDRVVLVSQRPTLFAGTIADNIRLGRAEASQQDVEAAAHRAAVTAFVRQLPAGFETRLGEGGLGLSGGEAQRVALARLFLRDPRLILLDEPTAHLDPETETQVLDALFDFAQSRTMVIVSHARALLDRPGRHLRLENGQLVPLKDGRMGA